MRIIVACMLPILAFSPTLGSVDLKAEAVSIARSGSDFEVSPKIRVYDSQQVTAYDIVVRLEQWRNGSLFSVILDTTLTGGTSTSSSCAPECKAQSCTGSCTVDDKAGTCETFVDNCDSVDGNRDCGCGGVDLGSFVVSLLAGDTIMLSVDAVNATESTPIDNDLSVVFH